MRFANALSFFRRQPAPIQQDPADMGTAFGMEASLEDGDYRSAGLDRGLESQRVASESDSPLAWLSRRSN